jgi:6-pyruvoyltetrahydropterin/6-carboxytetrahydropterin synthase
MGTERLYQIATASFEAARFLISFPPGHRERRLHGHSFLASVAFSSGERAFLDLDSELARCLVPLDYNLLNEFLSLPTDANLARWLRECLGLPTITVVGIQSTRDHGVTLNDDCLDFWHRFRFEAAHQLPQVAPGHPCGRMHGHGFDVILHADQSLCESDEVSGLDLLTDVWQPLHDILDGSCLNHLPGLDNPTSEVLAQWIWQRLKPCLPRLSRVTIHETATTGCQYDGVMFRIWKTLRFESGLRSLSTNGNRLHGHGYLLRLYLSAPLDVTMGWTVDYGEIKERFHAIYTQLDHHLLNELPGLADVSPGRLVYWIRDQAQPLLPWLNRIDLNETPHRGVILVWGDSEPVLVFES